MRGMKCLFSCLLLLAIWSCRTTPDVPALKPLKVPCRIGGEPNLFVSQAGKVYLSWIEYEDDSTDVLVFSILENEKWSAPREIARGSNWFVNWADFPSLVVYADDENAMAAHWLQKSAPATYDYDIRVSQSLDAGKTWGPSFILHSDSVHAEHGFVSMIPLEDGRIFATWLDGRNTKVSKPAEPENHSHGHGHDSGHGGSMSLYAATFDKTGKIQEETEIDSRVCDCCQTAAVGTPQRPLVAYRNRSDEEKRDIYYTRFTSAGWSIPRTVHADNWHITGCPVNGPALDALDNTVVLAWFTAADDQPGVYLAFSANGGITFGAPIRIDNGLPEGKVDVVLLEENRAMVCWLERTATGGEIRVAEVSPEKKVKPDFLVTQTSLSRRSGFPKMVKAGHQLLFAWTEVMDEEKEITQVTTGAINIWPRPE